MASDKIKSFGNIVNSDFLKKIVLPTPEEMNNLTESYFKDQEECPNRIGNWLNIFKSTDKIHIPKTSIVKVPRDVVTAFFLDKGEKDKEIIKEWIVNGFIPILNRDFKGAKTVFMKNGCYSGKFFFNNACKLDDFSIDNILNHILEIEEISLSNDIMGDIEFAIREYIEPSNNVTIYNGMPLRPEIRVFYDFDQHKYLYYAYYWEYNYMTDNLEGEDLVTFKEYYPKLDSLYKDMIKNDIPNIVNYLNEIDFKGIWSVDFLKEKDKVYLIDIAQAFRSAYWNPDKVKKV